MGKEIHFATVTRNTDEDEGAQLRGAIFFQSDTLTGDIEFSEPAEPCYPFATNSGGFFWVPEPGDIVEIEIDDALEHPVPRWRCGVYSSEDELAREFRKNYTKRMGFRTKTGHVLIWDDTDGEEEVFLEHKFGSRLKFFANGNISLKGRQVTERDDDDEADDVEAVEFEELLFDFENKLIKLHDHHANSIIMDSLGIKIQDKNSNEIIMESGKVTVNATGDCEINATAKVDIIAGTDCNITAGGTCAVTGTLITLNGSTGDVLTTVTDPVVDTIVGTPTVGVPTVKAG